MPHDVIMPMLGMAQDTGLIVAWHKQAGDEVAADDVLFEVETDKTTVEVPAGTKGFIASLLAAEGDEVPVGEVIAVITSEKPESPAAAPAKAKAAPAAPAPAAEPAAAVAAEPAATAPPPAKPATAAATAKVPPAIVPGDKVLASPKAKRLAAEQGLDLGHLAASGAPMPYHVADLDTLRALPVATGGSLHVTARVPQAAFAALLETVGDRATPSAILASFAAASLRAATRTRAASLDIRIEDRPLATQSETFRDPDLAPISSASATPPAGAPALVLRNLAGSRITGGVFGTETAPTLTLASDGDTFAMTLDFTAGNLDAEAAILLLDAFAGRLEDPLRHLL